MEFDYPQSWSSLRYPWIRVELFAYLDELVDPEQTLKWRRPDGKTMCGSDFVFHFFFDDHDFDLTDIGWSLIDDDEVAAIDLFKVELLAAYDAARLDPEWTRLASHEQDATLLDSVLWPGVVAAVASATRVLERNGRAVARS